MFLVKRCTAIPVSDIYLVLVGLEVWTGGQRIILVQSNASLTLYNFQQYKLQNITMQNDDAHLIM